MMSRSFQLDFNGLQAEVSAESERLLSGWADHLPDGAGGFHGEIDASGKADETAARSAILYTRLLWFFASIGKHKGNERGGDRRALLLADQAADYIRTHFIDPVHGGIYWLLDHEGRGCDPKKQAYAQAFGIYGLSAHYAATGNGKSLALARSLMGLIETRFWDAEQGGYVEALSEDWGAVTDQRLSQKDVDAPKTMNTHLHILEAYSLLHQVAPSEASSQALARVMSVFLERFVDATCGHLRLFFSKDWQALSQAVSYGHDIEASWLLWEAAQVLDDESIIDKVRPVTLALARSALTEGLGPEGGLYYERHSDGPLDKVGEWWGQAEALVGFLNAYHLSGEPAYAEAVQKVWGFVQREHMREGAFEWLWYPRSSGRAARYLAGLWKCPYHNGRALMEVEKRLKNNENA